MQVIYLFVIDTCKIKKKKTPGTFHQTVTAFLKLHVTTQVNT
jgi:hypothetical protein